MNSSEKQSLSLAVLSRVGVPAEVIDDIRSESGRTHADLERALGRHLSPAFVAPFLHAVLREKAEALDGASMIDDIATGGNGHVRVGWEWGIGKAVAKKHVADERITARREFEELLKISIACPDVAPPLLAIDGTDRILTTEYCDGMDLSHLVSAGFRRRIAFTVATLAKSATKLDRLHREARIAHRDVKPSNLLWDMAKQTLYVADFGNSQSISRSELVVSDHDAVTVMYCAPEDLQTRSLLDGTKADVFSLGLTGYALGTGEIPYDDSLTSTGIIVEKGVNGVPEHIERIREEMGPVLGDLLGRMMATDPGLRPTMTTCAQLLSAWDLELNGRLYGAEHPSSLLRFPTVSGGDPLRPYRRENRMRINPALVIEALDDMYPEFQRNTTYVLPDPK